MNCLLIFDHSNDIIFSKYNSDFDEHIRKVAVSQGLIHKGNNAGALDNMVFIQLLCPIVSSHRIMHFQFGNTYSTIKFADNMLMKFKEFMGCLFISISDGRIKNLTEMYVTLARYVCGADIAQLKENQKITEFYTELIDRWMNLWNTNQGVLVEAIEQLVVNNDIRSSCLQALKQSIGILSVHPECSKSHAILFVDDKFLALYSSGHAKQLSPADILFLMILTKCMSETIGDIKSFQLFLAETQPDPKSLPHIAHAVKLFENVSLVYLVELVNSAISASTYEIFHHLHKMRFIQAQREKESIKNGFDNLELSIKKLTESVKRSKVKSLDPIFNQLLYHWDDLKAKYKDYLKTLSEGSILRAETLSISFLEILIEFNKLTIDDTISACSFKHVSEVIPKITEGLSDFSDYFTVKSLKNFSMASNSLTINKYLQDFPGLVHFLYVDRNTHRLTTPALDMQADKAEFIQERIWKMKLFVHSHLEEGHTAVIWKDKIFTYSYFLWFETNTGHGLKLTTLETTLVHKNPGILYADYYMKLKRAYFPKTLPSKIRCYELFIIHLGPMTASSVLEQAGKLSSTLWELKGFPTNAIDLL